MRVVIGALVLLAIAGCAVAPASLPVGNLAVSAQVPMTDLRPKGEGDREIFSLMITNERYGYARLAQDLTDPTGARLFSHRLHERFGARPVPPVKLHHFVVYLNNRTELRNLASGAVGGIIGAALASAPASREGDTVHTLVDANAFAALSGENEYKRAFYDESELKPGTSALVVFIESESEGRRRFTRTVSPIKEQYRSLSVPLRDALESAIGFHVNP